MPLLSKPSDGMEDGKVKRYDGIQVRIIYVLRLAACQLPTSLSQCGRFRVAWKLGTCIKVLASVVCLADEGLSIIDLSGWASGIVFNIHYACLDMAQPRSSSIGHAVL